MLILTPKDFGSLVRDTRQARKLSQAALAARLGATQEWISRLESGINQNPGFMTVLRICQILAIDLSGRAHGTVASATDPKHQAVRKTPSRRRRGPTTSRKD